MMLETIVGIVGIVVTIISIIVTVISIMQTTKKHKHQKSNRRVDNNTMSSWFFFLHIDLHSFCFADMVIFYFQCTLYLQNITFVRFWSKKISLWWVYRTIHSSFLFITCVRFRNKKISSELLLRLFKYYISKI